MGLGDAVRNAIIDRAGWLVSTWSQTGQLNESNPSQWWLRARHDSGRSLCDMAKLLIVLVLTEVVGVSSTRLHKAMGSRGSSFGSINLIFVLYSYLNIPDIQHLPILRLDFSHLRIVSFLLAPPYLNAPASMLGARPFAVIPAI